MAKTKPILTREQVVRNQPTVYTFNFKDVPVSKYAETLDVLFHNPDYNDAVDKRNRLVKSSDRLRPGSSEMANIVRTIQQHDLSQLDPHRRVLGIIRPTVEAVGALTRTRHVGLLATPGTVSSQSYDLEICKLHPDIRLSGLACPMWVPLVENFEYDKPGADYFVKDRLDNLFQKDPLIDTLLLGCTHYPFLLPKIERYTPAGVRIITQGEYVARSLEDYLRRHPEMDAKCSRRGSCSFLTTEDADNFNTTACLFLQEKVHAHHIVLEE